MNKNVTKLFFFVQDFCKAINKNFAEKLLPNSKNPTRTPEITHSEIPTIILLYQQSRCENFKSFHTYYLKAPYGSDFQNLPTYSRFIRLKSRVLWYLAILLKWLCEQSKMTGISYIDATSIAVCYPKKARETMFSRDWRSLERSYTD